MMMDIAVAMGILAVAILPLAFSFAHETKLIRAEYHRAVAMEIVDGEMEILAKSDWKRIPDGTRDYSIHAKAAANLPAGTFQLTKAGNHLRLEWKSDRPAGIGAVVREVNAR
ncbi:MAG TPA: hypothetical protein VN625_10540 [Desulfuromonadaceae bacterium]|nr:hypothetical protein [Desulfuromonadaceae bacterium]